MLELNGGRRGGVSAGALSSLPPPTMNKTDQQRESILDTIAQNGFLRQVHANEPLVLIFAPALCETTGR